MGHLFQVTAKIEVNKKEVVCKTWTSESNYDACYFQIEKTASSFRKSEDDLIVTHILHVGASEIPDENYDND